MGKSENIFISKKIEIFIYMYSMNWFIITTTTVNVTNSLPNCVKLEKLETLFCKGKTYE